MLLRIFSTLFGYNYEVVKVQTTVSKQKILTLGTLILIPVSLWFFSGYYLSSSLYAVPTWKAVGIGAGLAILIFIIDRAFIVLTKANGGKDLGKFRVFIAILSTILGSLAMDLMIFSGDLKEYRAEKNQSMKEAKINSYKQEFGDDLNRLSEERSIATLAYDKAYEEYIEEIDGTSGTGRSGKGPAATAKEKRMNDAKADFDNADALFLIEQNALAITADSIAQVSIINEGSSVLSRVKDLHEFAFSHVINAFYYLAITAFFFCLEFFPFKYKSKVSESLFEKMLYAEELIGNQRLQTMMAHREETLRQDGLMGPRAEKVRQLNRIGDPLRRIG
ncbi:DUF4407 domain-containing protein [Algoriphagus sp.]|uniref:DUF4407 domain-containing protein n=1 Tax=Algoriphagus sp. TaxID=1872435 RepID=UPI003F6EEE87